MFVGHPSQLVARLQRKRSLQKRPMLETCFVVHWTVGADEQESGPLPSDAQHTLLLEELLAAYDSILKAILQYIRILSDVAEECCFTLCFNGKVVFRRIFCDEYSTLIPQISSFKAGFCVTGNVFLSFATLCESATAIAHDDDAESAAQKQKAGESSPSSVRLIVVTNDPSFSWEVVQFQMISAAYKCPPKAAALNLAHIADVWALDVRPAFPHAASKPNDCLQVSGSSPCCRSIYTSLDGLHLNLQKLCILLNDLMVLKVANIPMKKTADTTKTNYDVRFVFRRDQHVAGPAVDAFYGKGGESLEFFEAHREITFYWAKKNPITATGKICCSHVATPLDLVDSPTAVIMETLTKGTDFTLGMTGKAFPEHALIFRNKTLLFACYRYFDYDALHRSAALQTARYVPQYKTNIAALSKREFLEEVIAFISGKSIANPKDYALAEEHLRDVFAAYEHLNKTSFLSIDDLEPRMLFDIKECLLSMLSRQFNEKIVMAYFQSLLDYGKDDSTARPVFKFGTVDVKSKYLKVYLQISEYCALLKSISPFHANLHAEFRKRVIAFQNDHCKKASQAIASGYLGTGVTIVAATEDAVATSKKK